ncbi:MAG TPA: CehA/McbA family metallohydrolase [Gemmataceae bacterium]|nr:CehA/McbA family metallohydrolase [Gemmataceae bacterium]
MKSALRTVHVRVTDTSTSAPTPVRLRFTDPSGEYLAPMGRLAAFATGQNHDVGGNLLLGTRSYAYIDGSCEISLPPGRVLVEIHKGPEYKPLCHEVSLGVGQLALRYSLKRWIDPRQERWYSGDIRSHFLTPHGALLEGAAEDIAVVNLLAVEHRRHTKAAGEHPSIPNMLAFSGQRPALEAPERMVVVNTLNVHPALGSLGLLNCHRTVFPLSFGGPDGLDNWTLADWCDQCHRKRGLVVWTRAFPLEDESRLGEPLADLILGKIDALEITNFDDSPCGVLSDWYRLLNCGLFVPLVGGSGKDSNQIALGSMRTYARLQPGEDFTYANWIDAVRAGRTIVTSGPLLSFSVNGEDPGARVDLKTAGETVRIRAEARSLEPFDCLQILANGEVIASAEPSGAPFSAMIDADLPFSESVWLAARCWGQEQAAAGPHRRLLAHSSPVSIRVQQQRPRVDPEAATMLMDQLDKMLDWSLRKAHCDTDKQRENLAGIFREAKQHLSMQREARGRTCQP